MFSYNIDLHIHSCLSPCGDREMTPNNIVNMAKVRGVNILAVTDHNSVLNCGAVASLCEQNSMIFVPGLELCTAEEIHVICLFESVSRCEAFGEYVQSRLPKIKNKPTIFGDQLQLDKDDTTIKEVDLPLIFASSISIDDVSSLVAEYNGAAFPAHCDRPSFSIISSFGFIPAELDFSCIEVTSRDKENSVIEKYKGNKKPLVLVNSDAHYLKDIYKYNERITCKREIKATGDVINFLKGNKF